MYLKHVVTLCYPQETLYTYTGLDLLEIKGWKMIYHGNINQNVAGVTTLRTNNQETVVLNVYISTLEY